jgi:hypothetical protein
VIDAVLEIDVKEEVKKMVGDIKDAVAFVSPVTEEQINEVKSKLAAGINKILVKGSTETIPNFAQMLLKSEYAVSTLSEHFNEVLGQTKYVDEEGCRFYNSEMD